MIKAYAEPDRHFVEVKLGTEEMSDPLLVFQKFIQYLRMLSNKLTIKLVMRFLLSAFCQAIADAAKYEEEIYQPTDNVPVDNILNFEDYVKAYKE